MGIYGGLEARLIILTKGDPHLSGEFLPSGDSTDVTGSFRDLGPAAFSLLSTGTSFLGGKRKSSLLATYSA
jgi:hypothetical protein